MSPVDEYLDVCGIAPICIIKLDDGYGYTVGRRKVPGPDVVSVHWVSNQKLAPKIARMARRQMDKSTAEQALQHSASFYGARLTPNLIVMSRATIAAKKLQRMMDVLDQSGMLSEFKKQYRRRRIEATARGDGFMTYPNAMLRLRRALIAKLITKRPFEGARLVFDEVLRVP